MAGSRAVRVCKACKNHDMQLKDTKGRKEGNAVIYTMPLKVHSDGFWEPATDNPEWKQEDLSATAQVTEMVPGLREWQ